ncbi:MAG: rhomboid family intramembrane serine protease [Bacteriovoracaceae bacterium]|nr:rhomboid family intramembrane serine protease [Bacteriovoracaceae bacterium]
MNYQAPPLSRVNKILLIVIVAFFILHSLGHALGAFSLVQWFGLVPGSTFPLRLYTLLTYPWVETHLMSVLFNGLALWFLGSELERQWGEKIYLKFLFASIFLAGVLYLLIAAVILRGTWLGGGVLIGTAGFTYSLTAAYATLYPDREFLMMFAFPVKAKWFCLIMAGVELYLGVFSGNPASWGHLFAMLFGFLLIRYQTTPFLVWWFKGNQGSAQKKSRNASHLKLVKKDDENKPTHWH